MATRNRANILHRVLESYCNLQPPESDWKLVIVDNASTDKTGGVLASFAGRLPLLVLSESRLGKNFAINTALDHTEGDLVVFTDDDAFPSPDWLVRLRKAADEHPDFTLFGGMVRPRWERPPGDWLPWVNTGAVFAVSDSNWQDGPIDHARLFGPNMAIRASVFQSGSRFDVTIGPNSSKYAMGSETEFTLRLGREGHKAWFVRDAVVEHFIRAEQVEIGWILRRGTFFGRGQYRLYGQLASERSLKLMGVPLHLMRRIIKQAVLAAWNFVFKREEALFQARWQFSYLMGQIQEARELALVRQNNAAAAESLDKC